MLITMLCDLIVRCHLGMLYMFVKVIQSTDNHSIGDIIGDNIISKEMCAGKFTLRWGTVTF